MVSLLLLQALIATIGAMIGTSMLCQSIPYQEGFGAKQLAWLLHSAVVGAVIAPITLLGGPIMIRAACYTAGVVGGRWCSASLLSSNMNCLRLLSARFPLYFSFNAFSLVFLF